MSVKPAPRSSPSIRPGDANANIEGSFGPGGSMTPRRTSSPAGAPGPPLRPGPSPAPSAPRPPGPLPGRERRPPAGPQHPPGLPQRGARVGHEHVAPAAQDGVDAGGVEVDRLRVDDAELDVVDPVGRGALAGDLEHRLGEIGADQ